MAGQGGDLGASTYDQWKIAAGEYQAAWGRLRKSPFHTWIQKSATKYYQFFGETDAA